MSWWRDEWPEKRTNCDIWEEKDEEQDDDEKEKDDESDDQKKEEITAFEALQAKEFKGNAGFDALSLNQNFKHIFFLW